MSANSNIWANLNIKVINSLVRFVNAKGEGGEDCVLATDMRNKQLFIAGFLLKTYFHLFAKSELPT